jgi:hypothetical protein
MDNTENIIKGIDIIYKELNKHYHKIKPINVNNINDNDLIIKKKTIKENGYSGSLRVLKESIKLEIEETEEFIEIVQRYKKHKIIYNIPKKDDISILHVLYDPDVETPEFSLKYINVRKEDGVSGLLVVDKKDHKTQVIKL